MFVFGVMTAVNAEDGLCYAVLWQLFQYHGDQLHSRIIRYHLPNTYWFSHRCSIFISSNSPRTKNVRCFDIRPYHNEFSRWEYLYWLLNELANFSSIYHQPTYLLKMATQSTVRKFLSNKHSSNIPTYVTIFHPFSNTYSKSPHS